MKKSLLLAGALLVAVASFGQKKEIKKAQKAFVKGDADVAQMWLNTAATKLGEADLETKIDYYLAKGEIMFYPGFESMKEIVIPYGKVAFASKAGLHPANHFATIEDLTEVSELGRRVIEEGLQPVIFDIK